MYIKNNMTATASSSEHRRSGDGEPSTVQFPNALRTDGLAITYYDQSDLWLVPTVPHDFDFSERLATDGLSRGVVGMVRHRRGIRYCGDVDLISLPAIMNATNAQTGRGDVVEALRAVGRAVQAMHTRYGRLPVLSSIQAVAIDRSTGGAELLAPYQASEDTRPGDVFEALHTDALAQARTAEEVAMVTESFPQAYGQFMGSDQ